ncbi:MAG: hypothetical protein K2Z81_10270, partial [Cyanobacteria bacterium]|nr:hypothetical protein [Cyanobacteriota bacterium]
MTTSSNSASASGAAVLTHLSAKRKASAALMSTAVFLLMIVCVLATFDEKSVGVGEHSFSDPQRLCRKVCEFNASETQPEVLVLGSSLSLTPAIRADLGDVSDRMTGVERKLMVHDYSKASYFGSQLKEKVGRDISLINLSLPAAMISDDYVILRSALLSGKRPQLVVLAVSPRDFVSNVRQKH